MRRSDFSYTLPDGLIARFPPTQRGDSRLLHFDGASGALRDRRFADLPELLRAGDLLVLNDTRVVPARLHGSKESGGRVEILLERVSGPRSALVLVRASKPARAGSRIALDGGGEARVLGREGEFVELAFDVEPLELFERQGEIPLPPYLDRPAETLDRDRYQTVYARDPGAVAAPTAGLHFDEAMLACCRSAGVAIAQLTLHVGAGTFQPLRVEEVSQHVMHAERVAVGEEVCAEVAAAHARGGRVVAVGTTVVRALETAAASTDDAGLQPFAGESRLFIVPGYRFRIVDALLTNFHLPESTLLMLVSAFAGREATLAAYRHAVAERYRFFSYGDAMFVEPQPGALTARGGPHDV
jgi:S-adenosylmethionine:tRNA ribosyltransferase-isomerase